MKKVSALCLPLLALSATVDSGLKDTPQITIAPTTLDFGTVNIGHSQQKTVYITNNGDSAVMMGGVGGGTPDPFQALQNCQGKSLNPGESCEMFFTFKPTTSGNATTSSLGTWNDVPFNITMVGSAPVKQTHLLVGPNTFDFEDVQLGQSKDKTVYILNAGDEPVLISMAGLGVNNPFQAVQNCQGKYLQPGASCQLTYTFRPIVSGAASTYTYGTVNDIDFNVTLNANGVKPVDQLVIAPTSLDFGNVRVGDSKEKYAYITNVGEETVTMYGVGGGTADPFQAVQNCQGNPLKPGDSCYMEFTFKPTSSGASTTSSYGTWNGQAFNITLTGNTNSTEQLFLN